MHPKDLFKIWAPDSAIQWSKYAKPALFARIDPLSLPTGVTQIPNIPKDISQRNNSKTAIIVDLPGAQGVETGIGLAKIGFRPVPMYNAIHETKIGGLAQAVDNKPIINALLAGSEILRFVKIDDAAPPAFLIDHSRNKQMHSTGGIFDNRWNITPDDMPEAWSMKQNGINRVVLWTTGQQNRDLNMILDSYRLSGIEVLTFADGKILHEKNSSAMGGMGGIGMGGKNTFSHDFDRSSGRKEYVRKYENARFALMAVTGMAIVNFISMFFIYYEPILWTTPSIMWMTYLWVPEIVGDAIAVIFVATFALLYILSAKRREFMVVATAIFAIDMLVFYFYAIGYGLVSFTGYSLHYGIIVFAPPIVVMRLLVKGVKMAFKLKDMSEDTYVEYLSKLDKYDDSHGGRPVNRIFRGYRGYGGLGNGGYRGSTWVTNHSGRFGGGFGGGFGG